MSQPLSSKRCIPCEGSGQALSLDQAVSYLDQLHDWHLNTGCSLISRDIRTKDFMAAINLIARIAELAEQENHHPDLHLTGYRHLRIELSTHALGGLSENDFILAAKINELT